MSCHDILVITSENRNEVFQKKRRLRLSRAHMTKAFNSGFYVYAATAPVFVGAMPPRIDLPTDPKGS